MAQSPTHKLGQIIGELLERALRDPLEKVARKHDLYLDYKHPRPARQGRAKVSWKDSKGNLHDLDYVLESGGSEEVMGVPKAFIEIAYRRYTKHSRNKAQEVQGAIVPLAETYAKAHPFLGAVLGGVFTDGAVEQLRSHGFGVLYFSFDSIVTAFQKVGIDVYFDESSADRDVQRTVESLSALRERDWSRVAAALRRGHQADISSFLRELESTLGRLIETVIVLGLHGRTCEASSAEEAIAFVRSYDEASPAAAFVRYEINLRYTNGDDVRATFASKLEAIRFLEGVK